MLCRLSLGLAALLGTALTPAFPAEGGYGAVHPVGVFSRVRATEDHAYGHEIRLWRQANRMVGQLIYWDANREGQRGRFDDGAFNTRTGVVTFNVTVVRRDVQPDVRSTASFRGRLARSGLTGELSWEGKATQVPGRAGVESLDVPLATGERLNSFSDLDAWRKALAD